MAKVAPGPREALAEAVTRALPSILGHSAQISLIDRVRSPLSSWYGADVVSVHLTSGQVVEVFLKDFGSSHGHESRYSTVPSSMTSTRSDLVDRRERERFVYERLIGTLSLGTPKYYGQVWDENKGWFWLLLEMVHGAPLRYRDPAVWVQAASWLGSFHAHYARHSDELSQPRYLIQHDAEFFWAGARKAMASAKAFQPNISLRLERLIQEYLPMIDLLHDLSPSLVHGNFNSRNIIVADLRHGYRICPVDWEEAAFGSPLYDLAILSDGFDQSVVSQMVDAYRSKAETGGILPPDDAAMQAVLCFFRLSRILKMLSRRTERNYSEARVVEHLERGEEVIRTLI